MNSQAFLLLLFVLYVSFFSVSESINAKTITSAAKNGHKRPIKKGGAPISKRVKEAYKKLSKEKKSRATNRQGLNFDRCETDFDCQGARTCYGIDLSGNVGFCGISFPNECMCVNDDPFCVSTSDCSPGEDCITELSPDFDVCISNQIWPVDGSTESQPSNPSTGLQNDERPGSSGLALGYCTSNSDCQDPLKCFMTDVDGFYVDCNVALGRECFCDYDYENSDFDGTCTSASQCLSGEYCEDWGEVKYCTSETAYQGFNFDWCSSSSDCREARECYSYTDEGPLAPCTESAANCVCLQEDMICSDLYECAYWAESCYYLDDMDQSVCVSDVQLSQQRAQNMQGAIKGLESQPPSESTGEETSDEKQPQESNPADSDSAADESMSSGPQTQSANLDTPAAEASADAALESSEASVCIAVHSLTDLQPHELLYETHRSARVMCDGNNSCATAGHIVKYQGTAMMMKKYCALVGCKSEIMKVNSPRYRRGMQLPSMTKDLMFTAFAARYETSTEEKLLATAVRFGL